MDNKSRDGLHQKAYDLIKHGILNREIDPQKPLSEAKLASRLNLSRSPVREALRMLEKEGLVEYSPRVGWRLSLLTSQDIKEIFELKKLLEPIAAANAACVAPQEVKEYLIKLSEEMSQAIIEKNTDRWLEIDVEYHRKLLDYSGNRRLTQFIEILNDQWWRINMGVMVLKLRTEESSQEHMAISSAIADGDSSRARLLMEDHLSKVERSLQELLSTVFAIQNEL